MPTNYKTYFFCFSSMPFYETAFLNSNLLHHEMTFQSVHLLTFGPRSAKANLAAAEEFFSPSSSCLSLGIAADWSRLKPMPFVRLWTKTRQVICSKYSKSKKSTFTKQRRTRFAATECLTNGPTQASILFIFVLS